MMQKHLNHLIIMHTHKDRTEDIDMVDIVKTFNVSMIGEVHFLGAFNKNNYI